MNRDPHGLECTRDPIFLLQVGIRQWTQIPEGTEWIDGGLSIENVDDIEEWLEPYVIVEKDGWVSIREDEKFWKDAESMEGDNGWPLVYTEWRTESVWLTRDEAERYGNAKSYRWDKWRVYCVCAEGELARALSEMPEPADVQ